MLYDGDVESLKARYAPYRELVVHAGRPVEVSGVLATRYEQGRSWLRFDPARTQVADLIGAVLARYEVTDLSIVEPELEGVIRQIYAAGDRS